MYDIIVVGAGPAGAITGKYLAKSGKKVLLVQKDFTFKKPCGGGIRMDAFEEFNINKSLVKNVINEIVMATKKRSIEFDISNTPLAVVDRVEFDEALREDARIVGAEVIEGKVFDLEVSQNSVKVHVNIANQKVMYEAKYIIAADGVLSTVRKKLRGEVVSLFIVFG
jgi:geranylgeranyl reductase